MAVTLSGFSRVVQSAVIPGGAVGAHEVPGNLDASDTLLSVKHVSDDLLTNAELLAEFIISGTNAITNTTTVTTGNFLVVVWVKEQAD